MLSAQGKKFGLVSTGSLHRTRGLFVQIVDRPLQRLSFLHPGNIDGPKLLALVIPGGHTPGAASTGGKRHDGRNAGELE